MKKILKFCLFIFVTCLFCNAAFSANIDCAKLLAEDIVNAVLAQDIDAENDVVTISSDNLIPFFVAHIDVCRDYLLARTEEEDVFVDSDDLVMDLEWNYIIQEVTAALTTASDVRQMFVCENNRSGQVLLDVALWIPTAVATVMSFGTAGVVAAGVKAGVKQGAKNFVKFGVKKGVKTAAVEAVAKRMGKDIVAETATKKLALETAEKTVKELAVKKTSSSVIIAAKERLKQAGAKRVTTTALKKEITAGSASVAEKDAAMKLLDDYAAALAAKTAAKKAISATATEATASTALKRALTTFAISTPIALAGGFGATAYAWLESGFDPKVMNCYETDKDTGCYLSCTKDSLTAPSDDLNTKVFKRILGKNLCVDETNNYVLREIKSGGIPTAGDILYTTEAKWAEIKQSIISNVADQGHCDWAMDDIDMFVGIPLYDEATLLPTGNGATGLLIDGQRIDD